MSTVLRFVEQPFVGAETVGLLKDEKRAERSSLLSSLKRCITTRDLETGRKLHAEATKAGNDSNIYVASSLVTMYSKCGTMVDARRAFERTLSPPDVTLWTALILGYAENGEGETALKLFSQMKAQGCQPDARTYVAALKACTSFAVSEQGRLVDGKLVKMAALEAGMNISSGATSHGCGLRNNFLRSAMVSLLARCGDLVGARRVFDGITKHDVVSWNALVLGYTENGEERLALELYVEVQGEGLQPNARTFAGVFKACTGLAAKEAGSVKLFSLEVGMALHAEAAKHKLDSELYVASTLVDMYASCGSLEDSKRVFDSMTHRNMVSWNSLMTGYAENGQGERALEIFFGMIEEETQYQLSPNCRSFVAALKACGSLLSLQATQRVHGELCRRGFEVDGVLVTCLVDSYGKCGSMPRALQQFDSISLKDTLCWSALLAGYSREGDTAQVFKLFNEMQEEGVAADGTTFVSLLAACSHAGLVEKGKMYFEQMTSPKFGVAPVVEHYHCMIDMLGRANHLEEALHFLESMPFSPTAVTWKTLLASCRKWENGKVIYLKK